MTGHASDLTTTPRSYTATIDGGDGGEESYEAATAEEALALALAWAKGGSWDLSGGTIWVRVNVENDDDPDDALVERHYAIDPPGAAVRAPG